MLRGDLMSSDANEGEGYQVAENARYNDDDATRYNKRSIDNDMSGNAADTTETERANTQTDESAKTRTRGAANAERKRP